MKSYSSLKNTLLVYVSILCQFSAHPKYSAWISMLCVIQTYF